MKNVRWVFVLVLVVVGSVVGLVVALQNDSPRPRNDDKPRPRARAARSLDTPGARRAPLRRDSSVAGGHEGQSFQPGEAAGGGDVMVREDGTVVHDYRTRSNAAPDLSRSPRRPIERAKVKPETIISLRHAMRPVVRECAEEFSDELEPGARIQSELQVSIGSGVLTVGRSEAQTEGIRGDGFVDCVTQRVKNIELSVEAHDDVRRHMLTYPFRLPIN